MRPGTEMADRGDTVAPNRNIARHPWITRPIDDFSVLDDHVILARLLPRSLRRAFRLQRSVIRRRGNLSQSFADDFSRRLAIVPLDRNIVGVNRKRQSFPR